MNKEMEIKVNAKVDEIGFSVKGEPDSFSKLLPTFFTEYLAIWGDNMKLKRWKNAHKIIESAYDFMKKNGIKENHIPLKLGSQMLDKMSLEDNETIQEKWKNMLINASSGNKKVSDNYPLILNQLSEKEVKILDFEYDILLMTGGKNNASLWIIIKEKFSITDNELKVYIDNLYRLVLIERIGMSGIKSDGSYPLVEDKMKFRISDLGKSFIESCRIK